MSQEDLIQLLRKYKIPFESWGTGNSKPFEKFCSEINSSEAKLVERDNELFRLVSVVVMNVFYFNNNQHFKLKEDRQIYKDGRVVRRDLKDSLLEKLKPQEDPYSGALRALREELGITTKVTLNDNGMTSEIVEGKSYPGLMNHGTLYNYEAILSDKEFKQEGYIEIQDDKTSYFVWEQYRSTL